MEPVCKGVQVKLLLSQCDDDVIDHISHCESCWEAFMNLGLDHPLQRDVALASKKALLSQAADPSTEGDHRMEQFHLLSSLTFTPYAKKVFLDYFSTLEKGKSLVTEKWSDILALLEDTVYSRLQRKQKESANPQGPIDAEVMLGVLDELGTPAAFLQRTEAQQEVAAPAKEIRRLYRSREDRMIAGVCGGLGEYFRIDPIFLRILFVALLFAGGWSILVYLFLYFFLPLKPETEPILSSKTPPKSLPKANYSGLRFIRRLVFGFFVFLLFVCIYIPILAVLGGVSVGSMVLLFAPLSLPTPFHLSQLGLPALLGISSISLLFFSLFLLVLSFIIRLHFKKVMLGKNLQAIFIVFVIMSIFSSLACAGIVYSEFKAKSEVSQHKTFSLPQGTRELHLNKKQLAPLLHSRLPGSSLTIQTEKGLKQIKVQATLSARARSSALAAYHLRQIKWNWPAQDKLAFPRLKKKGDGFHFERLAVTVVLPEGLSLHLDDLPSQTTLEGRFGQKIKARNRRALLTLQNVQAQTIVLQNGQGKLRLYRVKTNSLRLTNRQGASRLSNVEATLLRLTNNQGSLRGSHLRGALQVQNKRGSVRLKVSGYRPQRKMTPSRTPWGPVSRPTSRPLVRQAPASRPAKVAQKPTAQQTVLQNKITNFQGSVRLYFPLDDIPALEINRLGGRVKNRLPWRTPNKKVRFTIENHRGSVRLLTWIPALALDAMARLHHLNHIKKMAINRIEQFSASHQHLH